METCVPGTVGDIVFTVCDIILVIIFGSMFVCVHKLLSVIKLSTCVKEVQRIGMEI